MWTLRTRIHPIGKVLISHDVQLEVSNQILNIWEEVDGKRKQDVIHGSGVHMCMDWVLVVREIYA
jgi:hypothetical protein